MERQTRIILILPFILLSIAGLLKAGPLTYSLLVTLWMVMWWIFDILPLGITGLIPLIFFPTLGLMNLNEVATHYANPVIYLFLGGFIIARALEKTKLNERLAIMIMKKTPHTSLGLIMGPVLATTFLSMWVSNTATTVMMVPIGMSIIKFLDRNMDLSEQDFRNFSITLFLSIAYAANIGGTMTPIGTPPNVVFIGYLRELYGIKIDFFRWFLMVAPVALLLLIVMLFVIKYFNPFDFKLRDNFKDYLEGKWISLGQSTMDQHVTLAVFVGTAFLWIFKGLLPFELNDTSIALGGGLLLFVIPLDQSCKRRVLSESDIKELPWSIVLLFGGGMALAGQLKAVGLIELGTNLFQQTDASSYWIIFGLAFIMLWMTNIMSNVALCVVALPLIMSIGDQLGINPILSALPAAICSSYAFSMPISTPPNAIVFGTGQISVKDMLKSGIVLNFLGHLFVMTFGYYLIGLIL